MLALSKQACGRPPFSTLPRRTPFRRGFAFYIFFRGALQRVCSLRRRRVVAIPAMNMNAVTPGAGTFFTGTYPSMKEVTDAKLLVDVV